MSGHLAQGFSANHGACQGASRMALQGVLRGLLPSLAAPATFPLLESEISKGTSYIKTQSLPVGR